MDQLVGAAEIAKRIGLREVRTVHLWARRHGDFPAPVAVLSAGKFWNWPDIERWLRATGRGGEVT